MPLYNKEAFVEKAVQSVLNQTFDKFELIIVDDGSDDASLKKVNLFHDDRVRVMHQEHNGVAAARNLGISMAKYEWIAFLDADDWWDIEYLETILNAIQGHPSYKIFATGRYRVFDELKERYKHQMLPNDGSVGKVDYIEMAGIGGLPPINASNAVVHRSLFEQHGFYNESMQAHEDHDLWFRFSLTENIIIANIPLSNYRKLSLNTKRVFTAKDFTHYLNTLNQLMNSLSQDRKRFLKKYCNRFILWNLYTYRKHYSAVDKKGIILQSKALISLPNYWILWILYRL